MKLKNIKSIYIIIVLGLVVLFFATRLYNILSLPIFTDEAIYVRWSQIAKQDANWRFISLTDGKQPLYVWITMVVMKFIKEPLLAGRLVSVGAGFMSMVGLFFLGRELFKNKWIGFISSALYIIFPMALVYDRMALYESLVGMFAVWSLYLTVLLVKSLLLDIALIFGMVVGAGMLTKTSAFLNIYLLPFSLLLFDWKEKFLQRRILKFTALVILSSVIAYGMYSILRLSPFFHIIAEKNAIFVYPLHEWIKHPFAYFHGNILGLWDWFRRYLTLSGVLLIVLSFIIDKKQYREKLFLFVMFAAPFLGLALLGNTLYPRYIFSMTVILLPLISVALYRMYHMTKNKLAAILVFILFALLPLWSDLFILTDFAHARIPFADLQQYSNDWTSGGGVQEAVAFFKEEAKDKKIFVGTQGTFGLMPYGLEIYLVQNPNIKIVGFWPIEQTPPKDLIEASAKMPTYILFYEPCSNCQGVGEAPTTWPVTLVNQYKRGIGNRPLSIYKVHP